MSDGISFTARCPGGDHDANWTSYVHPQPIVWSGYPMGVASCVAVDCRICGQVDDPPIDVLEPAA